DTGPMIMRSSVGIEPRDTSGTLHDRLAQAGSVAIVAVLQALARDGRLAATPQPEAGVTYAAKIGRTEAMIDWAASAQAIDRQVRAFDPAPGAFTFLRNEMWKIWRAEPGDEPHDATPGEVLGSAADAIVVACGRGALRVHDLQPAGGKRVAARSVLAGRRIAAGDVLGGVGS
ncbi:MAG TPA: methionyl-tRNA formyltransferase, partial [Casimicrobiaceae bacterium]|nr:methionyl-tRNA formyltransferase [Casimicrobiaceae bacterium]